MPRFVVRALLLLRTGGRLRASTRLPVQSLLAGRLFDPPPSAPLVRHWQRRAQNLRGLERVAARRRVPESRERGIGGQFPRGGNGKGKEVSYMFASRAALARR